jgi:hypothetical protein
MRGLASSLLSFALLATAAFARDIDGDGRDDVLWRQPNGQLVIASMQGLDAPSYRATGPAMDNRWLLLGAGRFGPDAPNSVLWLSSDGTVAEWFLQNGGYSTGCTMGNMGNLSGGRLVGLGDVDGDANTDLLWMDADGVVRVRLIATCQSTGLRVLGTPPEGAQAAEVADFDGDGRADILWHEASGAYSVWLLDGSGVRARAPLSPTVPADWAPSGVGDFNGDGRSDVLWRTGAGSFAVSYMQGAAHADDPVVPADADPVFADGFGDSTSITPPATLPADWRVIAVGDFDGDSDPDLLFANAQGRTQTWEMQGARVQAAALQPPALDMPWPGVTGWILPPSRPHVTMVDGHVTVSWPALPGAEGWTVYASPRPGAALHGTPVAAGSNAMAFDRMAPGFSDKRYFAVGARLFGLDTPPGPDGFLVEFALRDMPYVGPLAIADIDGDGCMDVMGALGNCAGGFTLLEEADMGLGALRANGRLWRDLRFADFDGDGLDDVIASVYAADEDPRSRVLFFRGVGGGHFVEDAAFTALGLGGHDETLVVADFDNDGDLDIFLPKYTFPDPTVHNYLLMNDGHGHFTDMADSAGVAMRQTPLTLRPEGAQAADLDDDGRLDIYAGSHLFMNRTVAAGAPVFVDEAALRGLPLQFDEGAKLLDWNNDGLLDLVLLDVSRGPQLWESSGYSFRFADVMPPAVSWREATGMNVGDFDGDGRPDIVANRGCAIVTSEECNYVPLPHEPPALLLARDGAYVQSDYFDDGVSDDERPYADLQTVADFDGSGALDAVVRYPFQSPPQTGLTRVLMNHATAPVIHVTVLGRSGERNQQGRVVRVRPTSKPGFVMTGVVDGGSGYLSNAPYTLDFAAPWPGDYIVDVRLSDRLVEARVRSGADLVVRADGATAGAVAPARVTALGAGVRARPD